MLLETAGRQAAPRVARLILVAALAVVPGCQDPNAVALQIGQPPKSPLAIRNAETKVVPAADQTAALANITQTLQDLGFAVGESSVELGVVTGSKSRDAEESGAVAGQIAMTVAFAVLGVAHSPVWDKVQDIHVTATVTPTRSPSDYSVRVSFDRYITNNHGKQWRTELIQDPKIYQDFFAKLQNSSTIAGPL